MASILAYLEHQAGAIVAEEYGQAIRDALLRLVQFPASGGPRPVLGPQVRITTIYPYILIYEHAPDTPELTLLRVLHGASDITAEIIMR